MADPKQNIGTGAAAGDGTEAPAHSAPPMVPNRTVEPRRGALKALVTVGGLAYAGALVAPALQFVTGESEGAGGGKARWIRVGRLDDLPEGEPRRWQVVGDERDAFTITREQTLGSVWVIRDKDKVRAMSATCPHLGCSIDAGADKKSFSCPCHTSKFAISGKAESGPSPRDMDPLDARVVEGWVEVDFRKFRTGVAERKEILMGLGDWLNERTGHRELVREALDEPVPGGARWAYVWGSALTLSLVVQAVTGWLLMAAYAPSATTAWASVHHITFTMKAGWLIRGVHHFGAQAMVILLGLHLGQTALYGAYRRPREMNWLFGIGLLFVTLGFALTGYLLPWDQKGYWATRVATNIAGTIPGVGAFTQNLLVGGPEYGHMTLTRFYTLHVGILPAAAALLVVAHIALFRKHGVTPPASADKRKVDLFFPKQVGMDLTIAALVLFLVFALALREHGAPLDAPADPASDYPARPEWYFLALFESLKYFHGSLEPVGAVGLPAVMVGYLVLLPFFDNDPAGTLRARAWKLAPMVFIGVAAGGLTLKSMLSDAADKSFQEGRKLATERADRAILLAKQGIPPDGPLAMMRSDPETRGAELFGKNCATCHRLGALAPPAGKETAPDLSGWGTKAWVLALLENPDSDKQFGKSCFKGQMPSMVRPPADPEAAKVFVAMKPGEMDEVATFLVAQAKGDRAEGSPGEKLVKTRCTSCHRLDGKAPDDEDALGPELRGWASPAWTEAQIANPGSGKTYPAGAMAADLKGHMPAFEEKLSEKDRKILATWMLKRASGS